VCENSMENENSVCSLTLSRQASAKIVFSMPVKARRVSRGTTPLAILFAFLREYIISLRCTRASRKRKRAGEEKKARDYFANGSIFIQGLKRTDSVYVTENCRISRRCSAKAQKYERNRRLLSENFSSISGNCR